MSSSQRAREAKDYLGAPPAFSSSSPGRIDLLNTHQDYKGLPVVPIAINLRVNMYAVSSDNEQFKIKSREMERLGRESEVTFGLDGGEITAKQFGNYFKGVVKTLTKKGLAKWKRGLKVYVASEVPVSKGMASSAAIEVGFMTLLNGAYGLGLSTRDVAEYSYQTETEEVRVPCGRLDQYSSAFGEGIILRGRPTVSVEHLKSLPFQFAVIDSGVRHETGAIHPVRQREINDGLRALLSYPTLPRRIKAKMGIRYDEISWDELDAKSLEPFFFLMGQSSAKRIMYTLEAQESTKVGIKLLKGENLSPDKIRQLSRVSVGSGAKQTREELLGAVMNQQHELLRDLYEVSIPEIEVMRDASLASGALGVKISGAGMGGSVVALVRNGGDAKAVIDAAMTAGAKSGWLVSPDKGAEYAKL